MIGVAAVMVDPEIGYVGRSSDWSLPNPVNIAAFFAVTGGASDWHGFSDWSGSSDWIAGSSDWIARVCACD